MRQLMAASDLVHGYLQTLAQGRTDAADAMWRNGHRPPGLSEGGLRDILPARVSKIRTLEPEPLDGATLRRVRVPVALRLTGQDGRLHVFDGTYTVEHPSADAPWKLSAAEVHARLD
ncbi:hypothetical protein [Cognatilysobacter terrigena]|uniref:hypothetical protein n=1 Tax=Cognatilysobacter terrigena TaxID=2488749 RepID=UPI00105BAEB7|nr:hypothetical protein [Lysobacter terrigena]